MYMIALPLLFSLILQFIISKIHKIPLVSLIKAATDCSFKTANVKVDEKLHQPILRESVY
ncbi:2578_t:CDS:2 [Funneliformis caledonium]|uniref:2578_t:CDS:1 n=1 Tax=Funneliformis caledonium TaxID=1117310 RepID=A0A9N9GHK1_9GLOM|nr:2578_t:CDS:2 [Funneliformis caledonium]